jgi:hypothetical protein
MCMRGSCSRTFVPWYRNRPLFSRSQNLGWSLGIDLKPVILDLVVPNALRFSGRLSTSQQTGWTPKIVTTREMTA